MLKSFFIISFLSVAACCVSAQSPFVGVIKFKGENKGISETSEASWTIKDGKSRLDIVSHTAQVPNMNLSFYFISVGVKMLAEDGKGGKLTYDVPYSSFTSNDFSTAFSVESTGKKESFAGYACEEYIVKTANSEVSCWVSNTTGINPSSFPNVVLGRGVFSVLQKNGIQGIPMKIVFKDFAGNVMTSQEIISIQASSVSDSELVVPGQ